MTGTERVLQVGGKRLEVEVPAGVRDGQRIRLSGKAEGGGAHLPHGPRRAPPHVHA